MTIHPSPSIVFHQRHALTNIAKRSLLSSTVILLKRCRYFSTAPQPSVIIDDDGNESINLAVPRAPALQPPKNGELMEVMIPKKPKLAQVHHHAKEELPENPTHVRYPPAEVALPLTSALKIVKPGEGAPSGLWPVFRLMDEDGRFRDSIETNSTADDEETWEGQDAFIKTLLSKHPNNPILLNELQNNTLLSSSSTLLHAQLTMIKLRSMDTILQNAQRQGRISFYMSCRGEEAIHIGAASALTLKDTIWAQYREAGVLMWRGFTLDQFADQCFANERDLGRGRQMPVHYGSRALNYHTISSPLGTQIIQAVGAAYHLKLKSIREEGPLEGCSVVFFGDGCASTSDFHAGCNFAATLECPVVFFCRNNGFAISTPIQEQFRGDGIVSRAPGYGMAGIRVDGNDIFAVYAAVREAKRYVLKYSKPIMIEAMTYRQSHHSTSDDSTRYRSAEDLQRWSHVYDPVRRFDRFLLKEGLMDEAGRAAVKDQQRMEVLRAMEAAEKRDKPDLKFLFEDVYKDIPPHLQRQKDGLLQHLEEYGEHYNNTHH